MEKAREVDNGKEQIPEFIADAAAFGRGRSLFQLGEFLPDLVPDRSGLAPVESHCRCLALDAVGADQSRQLTGHPADRRAFTLLAELGLLPGDGLLGGVVDDRIPENMGMAADQLFVDLLNHIPDIETPRFRGHLGVKDHLEQEIPEFSGQVVIAPFVDGLDDLIGLLQQVLTEGSMGLLAVPRTTLFAPQLCHDLHQPCKTPYIAPGLLFRHNLHASFLFKSMRQCIKNIAIFLLSRNLSPIITLK